MAGVSKMVAVTVTYPSQVLRARMQNQVLDVNVSSIHSMREILKEMWLKEKIRGFYR